MTALRRVTLRTLLAARVATGVLAAALPVAAQPTPAPAESPAPAPASPSPSPGAAAPVPPAAPAAGGKTVAVSLREAIGLALANNLDIRVEEFNPQVQATEVGRERAAFDPTVSARLQAAQDRSPTLSRVQGNDVRTIAGQAALTQRLPTGTQYELTYNTNRLRTNSPFATLNPAYSAEVLLNVTQPLLRNFGIDINRTAITVARGNREIALTNFRGQVIQSLFTTIQGYWSLVQALDALEVARESLRLAQRLLEQNRVQVRVGTLAPIEVTQAEAGVASREEGAIVAEAAVRDAEDRLKRALLIDPANVFDYTLVPTDRPEFTPVEIQLGPNLEAVTRLRPELAAARTDLQNREANLRLARNQRLPELNMVGSVGLNGLDTGFANAEEQLGTEAADQYQWSAGLLFSYPLGNRAGRNRVAGQELALRQARMALRNLDLQVAEEVRAAVRAVNTNVKRVEATRESTRLAREQLTAEQKRLAVGLSTSFEVLRLQTDLATARNAEIRAITEYRVSLANLDRTAGTLLDRVGVTVTE
jgi:outer membrane protein TolC